MHPKVKQYLKIMLLQIADFRQHQWHVRAFSGLSNPIHIIEKCKDILVYYFVLFCLLDYVIYTVFIFFWTTSAPMMSFYREQKTTTFQQDILQCLLVILIWLRICIWHPPVLLLLLRYSFKMCIFSAVFVSRLMLEYFTF